MAQEIDLPSLRQRRDEQSAVLLDVRLATDFTTQHIPGAVNNCVFEVAFGERLADAAPDPTRPVVVYGAHPDSHESRMAAEKLDRLGYTEVLDFRGGLQSWIDANEPIEGTGETPSPVPTLEGTHEVNYTESRIEWVGRNLLNKHWGTVPIVQGNLRFDGGELVEGEFTIDLMQIQCADLAGDPLHDVLVSHLHSDDFFDVENYPTAHLSITGARHLDAAPGGCNLHLDGTLTLRGQTHPVALAATAGMTPEGKAAAQASFALDRTAWGILYGSGKFFHRLAGHLVNDLIDFDVKVVTW